MLGPAGALGHYGSSGHGERQPPHGRIPLSATVDAPRGRVQAFQNNSYLFQTRQLTGYSNHWPPRTVWPYSEKPSQLKDTPTPVAQNRGNHLS